MSIVDALSKAKKNAQLRNQDVTLVQPREAVVPVAPPIVAQPPVPPAPQAPLKRIEPASVDLDPLTCRRNRLLLAGSEELLDRKVESAYSMLRTRLLQRARTQGWTTIGITSACPDDGKTLTALNLALSLAKEKNSEIFLLDLDMRNPSVFKCIGASPPDHIREYFEGSVALDSLFVTIGVDNLMLAGGAQVSDRSSELLSSNKFEELVNHIKQSSTNPLIIVDLPPVLITDDALVLAPRLDAILLVTSEGKTPRAELQRAVDTLSEFRLAGFVLNRSQDSVKGYGYY